MPTYLWRCSTCRKETETFKSIKNRDESPEEKCGCDSPHWEKVIDGGSGFILQGNGWFNRGGY